MDHKHTKTSQTKFTTMTPTAQQQYYYNTTVSTDWVADNHSHDNMPYDHGPGGQLLTDGIPSGLSPEVTAEYTGSETECDPCFDFDLDFANTTFPDLEDFSNTNNSPYALTQTVTASEAILLDHQLPRTQSTAILSDERTSSSPNTAMSGSLDQDLDEISLFLSKYHQFDELSAPSGDSMHLGQEHLVGNRNWLNENFGADLALSIPGTWSGEVQSNIDLYTAGPYCTQNPDGYCPGSDNRFCFADSFLQEDANENSMLREPSPESANDTLALGPSPKISVQGGDAQPRLALPRSAKRASQQRRTFICSYCAGKFTEERAKRRHEESIHYPNPAHNLHCRHENCSDSDKRFSRPDVLLRHQREKHDGKKRRPPQSIVNAHVPKRTGKCKTCS